MRVLVVDDDFYVVEALTKIFEREHEVIGCLDSLDAAEKIRREHFDAVVTDFMMPGLNGLELLTVCEQRFPHVRRVLITAAPTEPEVLEAVRSGLVQYLIDKPWSWKLLRAALTWG